VVEAVFDGLPTDIFTPDVEVTLDANNLGVSYHILMDNGHGRPWAIDWGMRIDDTPLQGTVRWISIIDQPSVEQIKLESTPYESTAGLPFWDGLTEWLPLAVPIVIDPRWGGYNFAFAAGTRYF
jgi:hypothetical protein